MPAPSHFALFRFVLLPLLAGAAAIFFLLPRPHGRQAFVGALLGILALVMAGFFVVPEASASVETVLFYTFSGLAVVAGTLLVTQSNPARAALSFTLVILSVCGLFLLLAAPFLMAATIIIYAGAIVVTFLFVIMLAQQTGLDDADMRSREPLLASLTGFILLGALLYVLRIGFWNDVRDLEPFLARLRAAGNAQTAQEMDDVLHRDPTELDRILEHLREEHSGMTEKELSSRLADPDFGARLRLALVLLGRKDLTDQIDNDQVHFMLPRPGDPEAADRMRDVIGKYETLALQAQQRVGLAQPEAKDAASQSPLSGPPSALSAKLRRDENGRPQLPAENSAFLGKSLFTDYLLPVELGGFLLLIATVGAIVIAHRQGTGRRMP